MKIWFFQAVTQPSPKTGTRASRYNVCTKHIFPNLYPKEPSVVLCYGERRAYVRPFIYPSAWPQ